MRKGLPAFNELWNRVFLCVLIVSTVSFIIPTVQFYNKSHRILGQSSQINFIFWPKSSSGNPTIYLKNARAWYSKRSSLCKPLR